MNLIRTICGIVAVLFSIQPLASWAAGSSEISKGSDSSQISLKKIEKASATETDCPPCCLGGRR